MWLLKIFGMFMIFLACSIGGILKARLIAVRTEVLRKTARSLSDLAERIRLSGGEIAELLNLCFKDIKIAETEGGFIALDCDLNEEDSALLNEFLKGLGMSDSQSEYNRAIGYSSLFENKFKEAQKDSKSLCKLYKSLGVLSGIFICIFFL